jgi:hypothetical protein
LSEGVKKVAAGVEISTPAATFNKTPEITGV